MTRIDRTAVIGPPSAAQRAVIRPVLPQESQRLRELRLRALRDSPGAFAASLAAEEAQPASYWSQLVAQSAPARDGVVLIAISDRRWVAMAGSRWFSRADGIAQLWGMWVEPAARGQGLGHALIDGIASWASQRGAALLRLGVIEPAAEIESFYQQLGFRRTGETKLLPPDGTISAFFLARSL